MARIASTGLYMAAVVVLVQSIDLLEAVGAAVALGVALALLRS